MKLPVLYLVDSIVKNIGAAYTTFFTQNIVATFCSVFEKVEESTRASMFKLRQTWSDVFPPKKLYALDVRVQSIDPAWPITAPPPSSIHVNPAFITREERVGYKPNPKKKPAAKAATVPPVAPVADLCETEMRESLLKKQKELLELQQKKLEIELLQTKARLQQQQIQMIQTTQHDMLVDVPLSSDLIALNATKSRVKKEEMHSMFPAVSSTCTTGDFLQIDELMDVSTGGKITEERCTVLKEENATCKLTSPKRSSSKSPDKKSSSSLDHSISPNHKNAKEEKKDKDKDKESRKGSKAEWKKKYLARKGKEQMQSGSAEQVDADVDMKPRNLREAAKAMPRIPKISERLPRDPRLQKPVAERRKLDTKKDNAVDAKKRKSNRFDDLFGNEDIDYRKGAVPALVAPVVPVVPIAPIVPAPSRDSPPRGVPAQGWAPNKRGPLPSRGRGMWPGRGRGGGVGVGGGGSGSGGRGPPIREDVPPWRDGEDSWEGPQGDDGGGSPRNMDFILEQAKENHRNGVINDGEYSTIIRQVFQMSESKMIREVQRRDSSGPVFPRDRDFRYPPGPGPGLGPGPIGPGPIGPGPIGPGPIGQGPGPYPEPIAAPMQERHMWNESMGRDPRFGGYPPAFDNRPPRYDHPASRGPMIPGGAPRAMGGALNTAFEVRPDEDMRTIPIDNIPREIRFYDDKAVILMAADDPRLLGFEPGIRTVFIDNMTVDCPIDGDYVDFILDGHIHKIKIGAPTRELYIDGKWYECMFGAPPITVHIGQRPVQVALTHNTPSVKIGTERRLDLLAGRVTMIIDAHSVVPVYLDLKLQHFEMEGSIYTLQFKDSLRTVVIDNYPYRVDFGGLPMAIQLNGKNHFVRFSSLPRGVEPGKVLLPLLNVDETKATVDEAKARAAGADTPPVNLDIGELLSKLVATGLLPGTEPNEKAAKPIPKEEIKKEENVKDVNLLDADSMKARPNAIVTMLYSGMQCGSCGLRFPADQTQRYSSHLDWHFRQNRRDKGASKKPQSRKWYCNTADWIQFEETETSDSKRLNWFETSKEKEMDGERNSEDTAAEEHTSVAVGSSPEENKCFICHEDLDQFFHEESEEWHLKDAVRFEGVTYHRLCHRDYLTTGDVGNYPICDSAVEEDDDDEENVLISSNEETNTETVIVSSVKEEEKEIVVKSEMDESAHSEILQQLEKEFSNVPVPSQPQMNGCIFSEITQPSEFQDSDVKDFVLQDSDVKDFVLQDSDVKDFVLQDSEVKHFVLEETEFLESEVKPFVLEETEFPESEVKDFVLQDTAIPESEVRDFVIEDTEIIDSEVKDFVLEETELPESEVKDFVLEETELAESEVKDFVHEEAELPESEVKDLEETELQDADMAVEVTEEDSMRAECDEPMEEESKELDELMNLVEEAPVEAMDILDDLLDAAAVEEPEKDVELETNALDTSIVSNSIDGNLEMSVQTTKTAAPSGIKIKINLFKKTPVVANVSDGDVGAKNELTGLEVTRSDGSLKYEVLDASSLTNKPRLVGRQLTVAAPINKGVETSGLCCIM